jgi:hypothetical protein
MPYASDPPILLCAHDEEIKVKVKISLQQVVKAHRKELRAD